MEFKVPEMGEGVHEGELVKWRIKVGDQVADDQPICEVMTDKATVEIPAPFAGKITGLLAKEGAMVSVGQAILSYDGAAGSTAGKTAAPAPKASVAVAPSATAAGVATWVPQANVSGAAESRVLAAPSTRRMAREAGVALTQVQPSGPHGRVMREDLQRFLSGGGFNAPIPMAKTTTTTGTTGVPSLRPRPTGGEQRVPFKGLRKKIAEKMRLSKDNAAHFTYVEEADVTNLVKLRTEAKELGAAQGVKVTYLPFIMKAMVAALRQFPALNSTLDEATGEIVYKYFYNISLSIQTDDGLTAPVVKGVEHKSIFEIAQDIEGIVTRAREKKLTREDFEGGTITLTNAGTIGGLFTTPIINFPEVAILGFNKIFRKPIVKTIKGRERLVIRDWTYFSISLDHRLVDGADAANFMKLFIRYVENPSLLVLESF